MVCEHQSEWKGDLTRTVFSFPDSDAPNLFSGIQGMKPASAHTRVRMQIEEDTPDSPEKQTGVSPDHA